MLAGSVLNGYHILDKQQMRRAVLQNKIEEILLMQGYEINPDGFMLPDKTKETLRKVHMYSKMERLRLQKEFIFDNVDFIKSHLLKGDLNIKKIKPKLIEVESGSKWDKMFRWWSYMWWSLPYERPIGRQMRFIVWDEEHQSPIGLIGLQSPILSWAARDDYLKIPYLNRDYWVNQSLNAQKLGALPPYNEILGGKLVAMLMTSKDVRMAFKEKYRDKKTVIKKVHIPPRLLFITTAGAYGKTPVYNRLNFNGTPVAIFMNFSKGFGSFHIPNQLYDSIIQYLQHSGLSVKRGYGTGPSRKMRLISFAMEQLGFKGGIRHSVRRGVYLFPFASNLPDIIQGKDLPNWYDNRTIDALTDFWKERWPLPRQENFIERVNMFNGAETVNKLLSEFD